MFILEHELLIVSTLLFTTLALVLSVIYIFVKHSLCHVKSYSKHVEDVLLSRFIVRHPGYMEHKDIVTISSILFTAYIAKDNLDEFIIRAFPL